MPDFAFWPQNKHKSSPLPSCPTIPVGSQPLLASVSHRPHDVFRLTGSINHHACTMLLDSGASQSYVSSAFAKKHDFKRTAATRQVQLADGSTCTATQLCGPVHLQIGTYVDCRHEFWCVNLMDDVDVVLGMTWLSTVNPSINWKSLQLSVHYGNQLHQLRSTHQHKLRNRARICSLRSIEKNIGTGDAVMFGFVRPCDLTAADDSRNHHSDTYNLFSVPCGSQLCTMHSTGSPSPAPPPPAPPSDAEKAAILQQIAELPGLQPEVRSLVSEYWDIFVEPPVGLPVHRHISHAIDIEPGASPPNVPPFRMSQPDM